MGAFTTAPCYRLYSIDDIHPGMFEVTEGGVAVAGEMYRMSDENLAPGLKPASRLTFIVGPVKLDNGQTVNGILFPQEIAEANYDDISEYGDWRKYMAAKES